MNWNAKLKDYIKPQQNEIWKNEISQNRQFKSNYESSYKEILEKFHNRGQDGSVTSLSNPLEAEKNKLSMQLKKQEILLQEALIDRNYIKTEVLPVLEHTLHLYEKNKFDLDSEIEGLEAKLKISPSKKPDNIIYEEDEFELPSKNMKNSRENSPAISPKQLLQYSFISTSKFSARPASAKMSLASPRNRFMTAQLKTKKVSKPAK